MSKARDLADSAQEINILDGKSFLDEDNLASDSATGIASQQSIKAYVDGITTTNITSTGALNSGSITSGFGNINNGSSTITTTGAITGGSFVIGSADINENDLESIDGITAGTVAASKAVVVNANKDITGFRNLTATGTISGTLSGAIASTTTATTQAESDDSTKVATTAYVTDKITTLIGGAPSTLNDLNELAAAINDDANYNSTLTTALATKLPLAGGTMTGDVLYNDNIKAKFGASSDLQIYHDGSNSYITDSGTGDLRLRGNNLALQTYGGAEYLTSSVNGAVTAYHNGSPKLATTSTGISVTGNATFADNGKAIFGAGSDLQIYHDGSHSRITDAGTGSLLIDGDEVYVRSSTGENKIIADTNGGVNLFYDNAAKIATTSSGVSVTGNVVVSGTVDGRDVATDGSKLDGVASSANNYSHPNHSGEVTSSGDGAMTIANNVVDEANLKVSNSPTNGYFLSAQSGNTGGLTWAEAGGGLTRISSTAISNVASFSFSGFDSSKYQSYIIILDAFFPASTQYANKFFMRSSVNGGSSYQNMTGPAYYNTSNGVLGSYGSQSSSTVTLHKQINNYSGHGLSGIIQITNPAVSGVAPMIHCSVVGRENASNNRTTAHQGFYMPDSGSTNINLLNWYFEYSNTVSGTITAYGITN